MKRILLIFSVALFLTACGKATESQSSEPSQEIETEEMMDEEPTELLVSDDQSTESEVDILINEYGDLSALDPASIQTTYANVLTDMGITSTVSADPHEIVWISPTADGSYVRPMSDEVGYFITDFENELVTDAPDLVYPIYYQASEYDESYYMISTIAIEGQAVSMALERLGDGYASTGEMIKVNVSRHADQWLFTFDSGAEKMTREAASQFPASQQDY